MAPNRKGGKGKKKIVIKRMENEDARQVTFSKRRRGLFNKASELAILTGAKIAAIVFSPGGRVFSFGHSSVDAVVKHFFAGEGAEDQDAAYDNKLGKLCQELDALRTELADYKNRKENMDDAMAKDRAAGDQMAAWVEADVDDMGDMGEEDMAKFAAGLMQVQATVSQRASQVLMEAYNVHYNLKMQVPTPAPPQHFAGSNFEFGSSRSSANAGMEMPPMPGFIPWMQTMMPMPSPQGFAAGMHMQQMSMEMPPWQGLATGMNMQQMPMATPPPQGGMLQLLLEMSPATQTEFLGATRGTVDAAFGDGVQQGLGPNAGFPY